MPTSPPSARALRADGRVLRPERAPGWRHRDRPRRGTRIGAGGERPLGRDSRSLADGRARGLDDHGTAGRRRLRRPAGLLVRCGGWLSHPPRRRHALPRLVVADSRAPRPFRRRLSSGRRRVVDLAPRQPPSPLPAGMDPRQAAVAAKLLGARLAVPIHYGPLHKAPNYVQAEDPSGSFESAGAELEVNVRVLRPGERLYVEPTESAPGRVHDKPRSRRARVRARRRGRVRPSPPARASALRAGR